MSKQSFQGSNRQFSVADKFKYFSERVNDVRLSSGQRMYAAARLEDLRSTYQAGSAAATKSASASNFSPKYDKAKKQLDERKAYHEAHRRDDPYSRGYDMGVSDYELYRTCERSGVPGAVADYRKTLKEGYAVYRDRAKRDFYPQSEDPSGFYNDCIVEAQGYVKALHDAANARKGFLLK